MDMVIAKKESGWRGARLLALKLFPNQLEKPSLLFDGLMSICTAGNIHCEMIIMKGEESERLQTLIILRWAGTQKDRLEKQMKLDSEMIQKQFATAQIQTEYIENTNQANVYFSLFRNCLGQKELTQDGIALGFYPREESKTNSKTDAYFPGKWTGAKEKLEWAEISIILSGYKKFLFSIQIIPTKLSSAEHGMLQKNTVWLNNNRADTHQNESSRFQELLNNKDNPFFLINLWTCGDKSFAQELYLYLQRKGLDMVRLQDKLLKQTGYLLDGDSRIGTYLDAVAHRKEYQNRHLNIALQRLTRLATIDETRTFFLPLGRLSEIRGLQMQGAVSVPVTLPDEMLGNQGSSVFIGRQEQTGRDVYLPIDDITRHGCIVGKPGSGKTTFALGFLYRMYKRKQSIPFLVIEPAKKEYRTLMQCIPELQVFTPGETTVSPMQMNMFLPPPGVTLEEYLPCVDQIFSMSFSMTSLLKDAYTKVIRRCYNRYGWMDDSTRDTAGVEYFGLHEFIQEFRTYTRETFYEAESRNNVENSGVVRLQKMLETNPVMFDTIRTPDYGRLLSAPTVIELDAISDPEQKSLVMAILIVNLMALIRKRTDYTGKIRNIIMIDEAHVILDADEKNRDIEASDPGRAGLKLLQEMTLIFRAYGTALFFGDQSPAKLTREIFGNVNMKLMFRMDDPDDRRTLGQCALMDQAMLEHIVSLRVGEGYLGCNRTGKPVLLQTPDTEKELELVKNVSDEAVAAKMGYVFPVPFIQCRRCTVCEGKCNVRIRKTAKYIAYSLMLKSKKLKEFLPADEKNARKVQSTLPSYLDTELYEEAETVCQERNMQWNEQIKSCVKIQIIRELLINGNCLLNEKELFGETAITKEAADSNKFETCILKEFRK